MPQAPASPPKQAWRGRAHAQAASLNGISAPASPGRPSSAAGMPPPSAPSEDVEMSEPLQDVTSQSNNISANGHQNSQLPDNSDNMHTAPQELPVSASATFNSSSIVTGTPVSTSSVKLTAMDYVRQMQQRASGVSPVSSRSPDSAMRAVQPSLPSIYNTPFAPTPIEQAQLTPKTGNSSRSPEYASAEMTTSAIMYNNQASPSPKFPIVGHQSPSFNKTPTGMNEILAAFQNKERTPSPFADSGEKVFQGRSQPRTTPRSPAPFGVIGQPRAFSSATPPNSQG